MMTRIRAAQVAFLVALLLPGSTGFQNLFPTFGTARAKAAAKLEESLIQAIEELGEDRLANSDMLNSLGSQLEDSG